MMRFLAFGISSVALSVLSPIPSAHSSPADCDFIAAAYTKLVDVPYRQIIKTGDVSSGEFVSMNNKLYAKVTDSWDQMPYPETARQKNMDRLFDKLSIKECTVEPDGEYEGKRMKVFSYIVPPIEGMSTEPSTQQIFIGSDDGLPYLMTTGNMRVELGYDNIVAPVE